MKQSEVYDRETSEEDDTDEDEDDDHENADDGGGCYVLDCLADLQSDVLAFCARHRSDLRIATIVLTTLLYFAYFGWSLHYAFGDEDSIRLVWITCLVVVCLALSLLFRCLRPKFVSISASRPIKYIRQHYIRINWFVAVSYTGQFNYWLIVMHSICFGHEFL